MEKGYRKTITACFVGYIVQAIVNNFVPLLFLTFHRNYDIPLTQITLLDAELCHPVAGGSAFCRIY